MHSLAAVSITDWKQTAGRIEQSSAATESDDLLPDIRYSYRANEQQFEQSLSFPSGTTPSQELTMHYLRKYPQGREVSVFYNPQDPQQSALERPRGDWLVLWFGLGAVVLGVVMLVFGT